MKQKKEMPQKMPRINETLKYIVTKMSKKYTNTMKPEVKRQFEIDMANALLEAIEPYESMDSWD